MPDPRIGFVIASFAREKLLALAIESIRRQSVTDWQLVVVDDGSSDGSLAVAERFAAQDSRIRALSQSNAGSAAARNRGLAALARSVAFVTFLDDDDVLEPGMLASLLPTLQEKPAAVGAYGLARMIDERGVEVRAETFMRRQIERRGVRGGRVARWRSDAPTTFDVLAFVNVIPAPGQVLIRRAALEKAGPFRAPADDWELYLRLTRYGELAFVPDVVLGYRWHAGNVSRNQLKMSRAKLIVSWRLLWMSGLTAAERRTAWLSFIYYYADLGRVARNARRVASRIAHAFRRLRAA
jgi:glycosyltransferase involved in cell wall biosynthesis